MVFLQMGFHHQQRKCWDPESVLFRISLWNPYWCEHGDELSSFHMFPMNFYIYIIPILIWKVNIVQSKMVIVGQLPTNFANDEHFVDFPCIFFGG